jgi:hypothetical protein
MLGQLWLTLMIMMNGGPVTGVFLWDFKGIYWWFNRKII